MRRSLVIVALVAAAVLVWRGRAAQACSCRAGFTELLLPGPGEPAPINTRVWVQWDHLGYASKVRAVLRTAEDKSAVPVDRYRSVSARLKTIELRPRRDLSPRTEYEVVLRVGSREDLVGSFTTGAARDTTPPRAKVTGYEYADPEALCCDCSTGDPFVTIDLAELRDAAVLGVWRARGGRVEYSRPPDAVFDVSRGSVILGHYSTCVGDNFPLPGGGTLTLGVRALDLAGNAGRPQRLRVRAEEGRAFPIYGL